MALDFYGLKALVMQELRPVRMKNPEFQKKRELADALQSRLSTNGDTFALLREDGTVNLYGKRNPKFKAVEQWKNVKAIAMGEDHIVGLLYDHTLVAAGKNDKLYRACNVDKLNGADGVCCTNRETFFLQNGVVSNTTDDSVYDSTYSNVEGIVQITCSRFRLAVLLSKGTVLAASERMDGKHSKMGAVSKWRNIVQIARSDEHIMGLRSDGTVLVDGNKDSIYNHFDACEWTNIVSIACSSFAAIGLRADGTVATLRNKQETGKWRNILAVGCYGQFVYGVRSDGAVLFSGYKPPCRTVITDGKIFENAETILADFARQEADGTQKLQFAKDRQRNQLCRYCGGTFRGVIAKVCTACGKKKDY